MSAGRSRSDRRVRDDAAIPPLGPDDHVDGPADAPLELVMYGDFQCPYCAASQSIVRRVRDRLDGRLRFAFRHMPLHDVHPAAQLAAEASRGGRRAGRVLADARPPLRRARQARVRGPRRARRGAGARRRARAPRAQRRDPRRARRARRAQRAGRGRQGTPAFFVNGVLHAGSFDAGSLVEALEAAQYRFGAPVARNSIAVRVDREQRADPEDDAGEHVDRRPRVGELRGSCPAATRRAGRASRSR